MDIVSGINANNFSDLLDVTRGSTPHSILVATPDVRLAVNKTIERTPGISQSVPDHLPWIVRWVARQTAPSVLDQVGPHLLPTIEPQQYGASKPLQHNFMKQPTMKTVAGFTANDQHAAQLQYPVNPAAPLLRIRTMFPGGTSQSRCTGHRRDYQERAPLERNKTGCASPFPPPPSSPFSLGVQALLGGIGEAFGSSNSTVVFLRLFF